MEKLLAHDTNASVYATFILIFNDAATSKFSSVKDVIGKSASQEWFDLPGKLLQKGKDHKLVATNSPRSRCSYNYHLVVGLDGKVEIISLELESRKACIVVRS
ncbi:hypothetical protein Patl1_29649 [Pistacia atlantica]|uniref:Uncharacterized protein n=1 Tax=Pistacia atlantica TaxID=434234 RepID=A0ACC1ACL4_9ROSI|nr:hypothetical protein Patl1_29649 [Pistacia atlantica]